VCGCVCVCVCVTLCVCVWYTRVRRLVWLAGDISTLNP
jgi:hypothetical protein